MPFFAFDGKIKPVSVACSIDIIMQNETMGISDSGSKGKITTLKSGIKL